MASSAGQWKVAGKDGKAQKNTGGHKRNKMKANEADLPKLDIKAPIPESKTQYAVFSTKEKEPFAIPKVDSSSTDSDTHIKPHNESSRKIEKKQHHREPQRSFNDIFNEALDKCDSLSMEHFIEESKEKCGSNQLVLLKSMTSFLQDTFNKLPLENPILENHSLDFPLSRLEEDVSNSITDELEQLNLNEINNLFSYCLDEMLVEINKGHATYGIRVMIQSILKCSPHVAVKNEKMHLKSVDKRKDNPREALSLLWALGQTSDHMDLEKRLSAWSTFFFPVIECKHLSEYVINYLRKTLCSKLPEKFTKTPVSAKHFQRLLEMTYGSNFVKFPFRRQLQLLYPEMKAIVLTVPSMMNVWGTESQLSDVFSELFSSLNVDLGKEYQQEALNCLVECLEKDATCHVRWRNNYVARLKESSLLLKTLSEQWESLCRSIPRKYLVETLREFEKINNELESRDKPKAGQIDCEACCKALLNGISNSPKYISKNEPSRITRIFKFLLFLLLIVVCVDMYKHDGYYGSKTSKILKRSGVEKILINSYDQGIRYAQQAESWAANSYPHYYKKVRDVVEPASDYTISKLGEGLHFIAKTTTPIRQYIHKTVPPLLEKFEAFVSHYFDTVSKTFLKLWAIYFPIVKRYSQSAWDTLAIWVPFVWARVQELALRSAAWVYNLSPDFFDGVADGFRQVANEVVTKSPHILALVQEYLLTTWNLLMGFLSDCVLWLKKNVIWSE